MVAVVGVAACFESTPVRARGCVPGNWSCRDYPYRPILGRPVPNCCWEAVGVPASLFEIVLGFLALCLVMKAVKRDMAWVYYSEPEQSERKAMKWENTEAGE